MGGPDSIHVRHEPLYLGMISFQFNRGIIRKFLTVGSNPQSFSWPDVEEDRS